MTKYKVQVVQSYWQTIEVEANDRDEAGEMAFDSFNVLKALPGDGEIYDIEIVQE